MGTAPDRPFRKLLRGHFAEGKRWGENFGPDDELAELGGGEARAGGVAGGVGGGLNADGAALSLDGAHGDDGVLDAALALLRGGSDDLDSLGGDGRGAALRFGFALDLLGPLVGLGFEGRGRGPTGREGAVGILLDLRGLRVLLDEWAGGLLGE